jgi:AcrR family transcriptional regulator
MTGQERRQQLLDIGRRLFAERGFEGTSIEEIAAQAGVSKPVVYEHFGGKRACTRSWWIARWNGC